MSVNTKLRLVIINFCFVFVCNAQVDYFNSANWLDNDYLDPHSLYYDKHAKKESLPSGDSDSHDIGEYKGGDASECHKQLHKCKSGRNTDVADESLSRRIVNIIISRAQFKNDGSYFTGHIELEASASELEALKNFGLGKLTLREVDPILNKVIQAPVFDVVRETAMWLHTVTNFLFYLLVQIWNFSLQQKEYTVVALALALLYYFLRRTRLNFWVVLTVTVQLIFVVSFFLTYWRLLQQAKIKHTAAHMKNIELPVQCEPHKMGVLDKLKSFFSKSDDCEKYFEAVMGEPMYEVTPAQALAHMLANAMYEPIVVGGKSISAFLTNLTGDMPLLLGWSIQYTLCFAFFPLLVLFIVLIFGGTLNLGFGPFSLFSLRGPQRSAPRQSERLESKNKREPIEVMLNITTNVQLPSAIADASGRSNNLTITAGPECNGKDQEKKASTQEEITCDDKGSGDSETSNSPETLRESDEAGAEAEVQESKLVERGSGDHGCSSEGTIKT